MAKHRGALLAGSDAAFKETQALLDEMKNKGDRRMLPLPLRVTLPVRTTRNAPCSVIPMLPTTEGKTS